VDEHWKHFKNEECEYFPCHSGLDNQVYNCKFCFCPLYPYSDCGGKFSVISNEHGCSIKDCSECLLPHKDADYVINFLIRKNNGG
jgi:Zn-finger protein